MHELTITLSIVNIAEEEVRKASAQKVEEIEMEIGQLSGVEVDSLEFLWEEAVRSSVLESAERKIYHIPGKARCMECDIEFEIEQIFDPCPKCQQYFNDIVAGKELRIKSLTVT